MCGTAGNGSQSHEAWLYHAQKLDPKKQQEICGTTRMGGSMVNIVTKSRQFAGACSLEVEVGTTGARGGDAGHGCRTYLRLRIFGAEMRVEVPQRRDEVALIFGGDAELGNLIDALEFALDVLRDSAGDGTFDDRPTIGSRSVD
jgi:hypothetical protein